MRSLIEFNYNAGVCDSMGTPRLDFKSFMESQSFFYRDRADDEVLPHYIGPSGMFTGTPYVVMVAQDKDYMKLTGGKTVTPMLKFLPVTNTAIDKRINLGLTSVAQNNNILARSELSDVQQSAFARQQKAAQQAELDGQRYSSAIANAIDAWNPMESVDSLMKRNTLATVVNTGALGDRFSLSEDGGVKVDLTDVGGVIDKIAEIDTNNFTNIVTSVGQSVGVNSTVLNLLTSDDNTTNTNVALVNSDKKKELVKTDIQTT
jgi:hypothetical protein